MFRIEHVLMSADIHITSLLVREGMNQPYSVTCGDINLHFQSVLNDLEPCKFAVNNILFTSTPSVLLIVLSWLLVS